jgi:hypothetical protein
MVNVKVRRVQRAFWHTAINSLARLIAWLRLRLGNRNGLRLDDRNTSRDISRNVWYDRLRDNRLWDCNSRNLKSWKQCSQVPSID